MNFYEKILYYFIFLCYRWIPILYFEKQLSNFEDKMIKKYLLKSIVKSIQIPTINAFDLDEILFTKISNNYKNPVLIKGFMKDTPAVKKWTLNYLNNHIDSNFKINCMSYNDKLQIIPLTFSQFIEKKKGNIYINNNHTILSHFKILFNDIKQRFLLLRDILRKIPNSFL